MHREFPILYKKDSMGRVRRWHMVLNESDGSYATLAGIVDVGSSMVQSSWTIAVPKNVGRANETTALQQAIAEVESAYKKKQKTGYVLDIAAVDEGLSFIQPMLAKDYNDYLYVKGAWHMPEAGYYIQPKLDGIRCIARASGLFSRKGEPIVSCPHIEEAVAPIFAQWPDVVLDGELYNHELKNDFNSIASLVNKRKNLEPERTRALIRYHVYDIVLDLPFFERHLVICNRIAFLDSQGSEFIERVKTIKVETRDDLDSWYGRFLGQGYEGAIIRDGSAHYEHKRTRALLKRKEFIDEEFEILDVFEGVGNRSGMAGSIACRLPDGRSFHANILGGFDFYRKLLAERSQVIGKKATVQYFCRTPAGIPLFPVVKTII